jgi:hypothetical protein
MSKDWESKSVLVWADAGTYQWSQTLTDVKVRCPVAAGVRGKDVQYSLTPTTIKVGLKGQPPLVEGQLFERVVPGESLWTLETEGERRFIEIGLQKQIKHSSWQSVVLGGPVLNPLVKEQLDKKMMLEKFQSEHAGFDFSGAEFTGNLPADPASFGDSWKK